MVTQTPNRHKLDKLIVNNHGISHARGVPYYDLCSMKESVCRAHRLYNRKLPTFDVLYMLQIIPYGDLQRQYKDSSQWLSHQQA